MLAFGLAYESNAQGIVDCIVQPKIAVSRVRGQAFDPQGVPVPNVTISAERDLSAIIKSKTDSNGRFDLKLPDGTYRLRAELVGFEITTADLEVGRDLFTLLRPRSLKVILALPGYNCPWVTTSERVLRESTRKNATQN